MAILIFVTAFSFILPAIDQHRHSFRIANLIRGSDKRAEVAAYGNIDPSLIFYANRPITSYHAVKNVAAFLGQPNAVLLTTDQRYEDIVEVVPPQMTVLAEAPRFFRREKWILVGRPEMIGKLDADQISPH